MTFPDVVPRREWLAARGELRDKEKHLARQREALNDERQTLPMWKVEETPFFEGPDGPLRLRDLFAGRRQLIVYHFWFEPGAAPCDGCSLWTDDLGDLGGDFANLHRHDTSLAFVSRASQAEIASVKGQHGWNMPWFTVADETFNKVTGYEGWAQLSIFVHDGEHSHLANIVPMEDLTAIGNHWTLLERCPFGLAGS
ncbi:DUF899 family protein [Pelagerythrobacter marensis]|uniref:DUF899 family protein n=1 Tax=Pelagerythrobacter marensis TaxID=543877 RepID=A0ABZ2D4V0_9SPHN